MVKRTKVALVFAGLLAGGLLAGEADDVAGLIRKLGSNRFAERESAGRSLEKLGAKALPALAKAKDSPNAEIRGRARILLPQIRKNVESARYAGAFRVAAAPAKGKKTAGFHIEVASPPNITVQELVSCRFDRAIDDQGQDLRALLIAQIARADTRSLPILAPQTKSKRLKEVRGTITAGIQVQIAIEVGDIIKAAGKTAQGPGAETVKILAVKERQDDGVVDVHLHFENFAPEDVEQPPVMRVRPGVVVLLGPEDILADRLNLLDALDIPFQRLNFSSKLLEGKQVYDMRLTYRPQPGQGSPVRLRYGHQRSVQVDIPFTLRNVSYP